MNYELAKKLKDAGFPQGGRGWVFNLVDDGPEYDEVWTTVEYPTIQTRAATLSELIAACGADFNMLIRVDNEDWYAGNYTDIKKDGTTPEEAVANLWLALNEKP